jgi:hypothetical protein
MAAPESDLPDPHDHYGDAALQATLQQAYDDLVASGTEESEARVIMAHGGPPFLRYGPPGIRQPVERHQPKHTTRRQRG